MVSVLTETTMRQLAATRLCQSRGTLIYYEESLHLCCQGGSEGGVVINPSALTPNCWQVSAAGAVGQELKLRLCKHLAGFGVSIFSHGHADGQPLLLS